MTTNSESTQSSSPRDLTLIKQQILSALLHTEAEDGLYLNNLQVVHEEEERSAVQGTQLEILDALKEMIAAGEVLTRDGGSGTIFYLAGN